MARPDMYSGLASSRPPRTPQNPPNPLDTLHFFMYNKNTFTRRLSTVFPPCEVGVG